MAVGHPVLVMIQGPAPGSLYKLRDNRVTTIGRSSRNSIPVVNPSVSRFHCEIAWVNGLWRINDLNSKKGTVVNGEWIQDRCVLKPGDIIRLATIVFRFDMMSETALQDGAIVAIMEAELDQKLAPKGEATGSLEDIRARSRLEGEEAVRPRRKRSALRANLTFVAAAAVFVAAVAGSVLFCAREVVRAPQEARDLQEARLQALWAEVEQKLSLVAARETESDYGAALAFYDELDQKNPEEPLRELLRERKQLTVRLARGSFEATQRNARLQIEKGNTQAALALYRKARDRIGLPELAAQADTMIARLEQGTAG
ncbi:MAG: FHA domain-containing protein [Planctomycetota bacterium]